MVILDTIITALVLVMFWPLLSCFVAFPLDQSGYGLYDPDISQIYAVSFVLLAILVNVRNSL